MDKEAGPEERCIGRPCPTSARNRFSKENGPTKFWPALELGHATTVMQFVGVARWAGDSG